MYVKPFNTCQRFKNYKRRHGNLPHKIISELNQYKWVHIDLIGAYTDSIIHQNSGGTKLQNVISLTCMTIVDPGIGWFKTIQ